MSGALDFDAYIENRQFKRSIEEMKRSVDNFSTNAERDFRRLEQSGSGLGPKIAAALSGVALAGFANKIIEVRGQFQKFDAILTNSLGSQQAAAESLSMLTEIASRTPFQLDALTGAYVKLVNQGFKPTREEIVKLGDLASSVGKDFDQLAEAIIDAQTGEFERLKEFGIKASKSGDQLTLSFKGQKTTIDNTAESIRDYVLSLGDMQGVKGSMEAISKTLVGQVSNLQDAITSMLNEIGGNSEGVLSGAVGAAKGLVENYELVGKAVAALVVTFGTYKAATVLVTVANTAAANAAAGLTIAQQLQMKATLLATSAQNVLNKTMLANPYVAVATAIAAVVGGLLLFRDRTIEVKQASELLSEAQSDIAKGVAEQRAEIEPLTRQLQNLNVSEQTRQKAYEQLKKISPSIVEGLSLEEAATSKLTDRVKDYITELEKSIRLKVYQGKLAEVIQPQEELRMKLDQLQIDYEKAASKAEAFAKTKKVDVKGAVATATMGMQLEIDKTKKEYEAATKAVTDFNKQMERLNISAETPKTDKPAAGGDAPKIDDKTKSKIDDEISYRKEQYELYAKWVRAYGQQSADEQFSTLLQSGKSMKEYLETEIAKLEARKANLSKQDKQNLTALKGTYIDYKTTDPVAEIQQMDSKGYQKNLETKLSLNKNFKEQELRLAELTNEKLKDLSTDELRTWVKLAEYKLATLDIQSQAYQELATRIQLVNGIISGDEMQNSAESFSKWAGLASQAINELSASIGGLDSETADLIKQLGGLADGIGSISSGMASGNSEDMISGVIASSGSYYTMVYENLSNAWSLIDGSYQKEKDTQKAEEERLQVLEDISRAYQEIGYELEYQMNLNEKLTTGSKLYADSKAISDNIKRNTEELQNMTFANNNGGTFDYSYLMFVTKARTEVEAIQKALSSGLIKEDEAEMAMEFATAIEGGVKSLEQLKQEYAEYITGTSVSSLVDEMTAMFEQGKTSAADFAQTFEDLMKQAMLQSLKMKILEPMLQQWFDDFSKGAGSNDPYWMQYMRNQWGELTGNATAAWEDMQGVLEGWFGTSQALDPGTSLTGAFKGVTEETASVVVGQMNAIRLNQAIGLDVMREQLLSLKKIEGNSENLKYLVEIRNLLRSGSNSVSGTRSNGIMF